MDGGQTREHARLIRSLGADQILVEVNKMDALEYSMERFDIIRQKLGTFLRSCGFKDSSMFWSAMKKKQIWLMVLPMCDSPGFRGLVCWMQVILSNLLMGTTQSLYFCQVIKSQPQGQLSVSGKVETGDLRSVSKVLSHTFSLLFIIRYQHETLP